MSLQVWLPLNGDLHNQGLSNITVTNNGATVDNSGKIGKCYSVGSSKRITSTIDTSKLKANSISFACWVYITSWNSSYDCIMSIADGTGWNQSRATLCRNNTASTLTWNIANNSASARVSTTTSISLNTWTHIAATYDGATLKIYLNGVLNNSAATTLSIAYAGALNIGSWTNANNYPLTGKINDVRIYDYALSPKEVEEIAKGLVLHYKLDDRFCEATTNLVTSITSGGQTTVSNNIVTTSGTNADTYFTLNLSENITNGTQYTIQCYAEMPAGTTWTFPIGAQSNSSLSWILKPGYNEYTFTANDISWGTKRIFLDDLSGSARSSGVQCKFYNFQVEKKNHATGFAGYGATRSPTTIYDSSGYSHNGTIVGSLTAAAGSPRYDVATQFPGSTYISESNEITTTDSTISLWINPSLSAAAHILDARNSSESGKQPIYAYTNGSIQTGGSANYVTSNTGLLVANTWTHLVLVQSGNSLLIYKNGTLFQTLSCTNSPLIKPTLGARLNAANKYTGKLSDFRIYATALTATQIKELYNTSMSIDSNGNVYARELNEL